MTARSADDELQIGEWRARASSGGIERDGEFRRLEPKVADLLFLLASRHGDVVTREEIQAALWPNVVVGEDALPRCVSKLRRALDDDAAQPRFIQTIPKRGYRLLAAGADPAGSEKSPSRRSSPYGFRLSLYAMAGLVILAVAWFVASERLDEADSADALVQQGLDYYSQYTRAANESAIELFEQVLARDPDNALAMSSLANALGQRALRWPEETGVPPPQHSTLTRALREGRLQLPNASMNLDAARALAERSVRLAPDSAASYKALGLVLSAQGDIDAAIDAYENALTRDSQAWGVMINLGELYQYKGDRTRGLELFERAYAIRPHYAELGVLIGKEYEVAGRFQEAKLRYLNVLDYAPFHREATLALAQLLSGHGEPAEAAHRCARLVDRTGPFPACQKFIEY